MQENKKGAIVFSTLSLLFVSGIIACLVALVNNFTEPVIAKYNEETLRSNIETIFPGSGEYNDITSTISETDGVTAVYEVKNTTGGSDNYCVHASAPGYGGAVELLVGFDCDGLIVGVAVLNADGETPGVGQRITEKTFTSGFKGLKYDNEGATVDGVTGATVSSKAAVTAVNNACKAMEKLLNGAQSGEVSEEISQEEVAQ